MAIPERVGDPFDVMGLTTAGDRWLASGHPGAEMNAPPDLGLLESNDKGQSWTDVSLSGQVDFHRLTASGDTVLGVNSGDGQLWRSTDGGKNWNTAGAGPFDVALDPNNPQRAIATTQNGPTASPDGGSIPGSRLPDAPLIALIAWNPSQREWGVTPDGTPRVRPSNAGQTWRETGKVTGSPSALTASPSHVNVLSGDTIWESLDPRRHIRAPRQRHPRTLTNDQGSPIMGGAPRSGRTRTRDAHAEHCPHPHPHPPGIRVSHASRRHRRPRLGMPPVRDDPGHRGY